MFFDDNFDLNPLNEPDSSLAYDGNESCDLTSLDYSQWTGKVRRETACKNPMGQTEIPKNPDKPDPFDFNQFAGAQALRIFPKLVEICPTYRFGTSNTPVCKDISNGDVIGVPGLLPVTLLNVEPRMLSSSFFSSDKRQYLFFFLAKTANRNPQSAPKPTRMFVRRTNVVLP